MELPQELQHEIADAANLISEAGELPASVRKRLFEAVENLSALEHVNAGYLRRARLALICAFAVLDRLVQYPEVHAAAETALANGIAALSSKFELDVLQRENGAFQTKTEDLLEHGEIAFVPFYAGMTCFCAINTILYDTNFDALGEDEIVTPPDEWDVGFCASLVFSGSAIWEAKGGEEERRAYWLWYLEHAFPKAWDVLTPLI